MTGASLAAFLATAYPVVASSQNAERAVTVSVPPSPAPEAINRLAGQLGADVVVAVDLSGRRTPGLRGVYTFASAFERLLRPLGARAVPLGRGVYRIEAAPRPVKVHPRPATPAVSETTTVLDEIVVTAPVLRGGLDGANGRSVMDPGALDRARGAASSETIADLSATVDSTRQGPGRNKLFVRGLADSAFSGPLQATVGQYLGDLRLTYGSPDPDLTLIDMRRVEVFEGPQGGRFGAGSIGGVVRITPEPPDLDAGYGAASIGGSATAGGSAGGDAALVLNRAVGSSAALRFVAYGRRDGGFVANPVRGEDDADGVKTTGGRASLRWTGNAWTLDALVLAQGTRAEDAPLVADPDELENDRLIPQPYRSALSLAGVTFSRRFGDVRITSATSLSRQTLKERFDASSPTDPGGAVVDRRQATTAFSSEARIETDPSTVWSWNGGAALAIGETRVSRDRLSLGRVEAARSVNHDRRFTELAIFGEAILRPTDALAFSIGGRLSRVRIMSTLDGYGVQNHRDIGPDGAARSFTPTFGASWGAASGLQVFGRYEQGVRPGGVSEIDGSLQRYRPDQVGLVEAGVRVPPGAGPVNIEASIGRLDWRDIQADTVTIGGDLVMGNIGDGVIAFVQLKAAWRPTEALGVSGGVFLNRSRIDLEGLGTIGVDGGAIPNVAPVGAQFSLDYGPVRFAHRDLTLGADLRYVGRSQVGLGPGLDTPQGGYVRGELTLRYGDDARAVIVQLANPLDTRGVRFGIGSPYRLFDPQVVPVRPLTLRIGFETAF